MGLSVTSKVNKNEDLRLATGAYLIKVANYF